MTIVLARCGSPHMQRSLAEAQLSGKIEFYSAAAPNRGTARALWLAGVALMLALVLRRTGSSAGGLVGMKSNRSAIGARVAAHHGGKIQAQEVLSQASFYSANDRRLHFGLGAASKADLEIRWPNGNQERVENVPADRLVVIQEGAGVVREDRFDQRVLKSSSPAKTGP